MISGTTGAPLRLDLDRRLEDGAGLHLVDLGHGDAQPDPAHPQHRVEFGQRLDPAGDLGQRLVERLGQLAHALAAVRQELVQRRVEQADADRLAGHDLEQPHEIRALHRQQPVQRGGAVLGLSAKIISRITVRRSSSKNMCSVRQRPMPSASNIRAVVASAGRVGIGADADVAHRIGPVQQRPEGVVERRFQHLGRAGQRLAAGAVDGDHVALAEDPAVGGRQRPVAGVRASGRRRRRRRAGQGRGRSPRHGW